MPRTTEAAVKAIADYDTNAAIDITPFIEAANVMVTDVCVPLGYDDSRLELIERWLSAHFYHVRDPRTASESAGKVSASYQSKVDLGLDVTHYGQMAKRLDTKGGLAALENTQKTIKGGRPSVFWLGASNC